MTKLTVTDKDEGQRLNKYLMKYLSKAPASFIYKMLRKKNITLNGKKAKGDEKVSAADIITLYMSDETIADLRNVENSKAVCENRPHKLKILYLDDDIMAVHKPAGVLSQKAAASDYSINEAIVDYCRLNGIAGENGSLFKPSVCNRLDRNTSGIILAGISLRGSRYLSEMLRLRGFNKYYCTIVSGIMKHTIYDKAFITKKDDKNLSCVISASDYERLTSDTKKLYSGIETKFIPVSSSNGYTLVVVELITGKSHQIRAHTSYLGYNVLGDVKYGNSDINHMLFNKYRLKYQLLHAMEVVIPDYKEKTALVIKDELPDIFVQICRELGLNDKIWEAGVWQHGIQED